MTLMIAILLFIILLIGSISICHKGGYTFGTKTIDEVKTPPKGNSYFRR